MALTEKQREAIKTALIKQRKKPSGEVQGISAPRWLEVRYFKELDKLVRAVNDVVDKKILPVLEKNESKYVENSVRVFQYAEPVEALTKTVVKDLTRIREDLDKFAEELAQGFAKRGDVFHRKAFVASLKKGIGVDVTDILTDKGIKKAVDKTIKANVKLIKDLPREQIKRIEVAVRSGLTSGDDFASIQKQIRAIEGITKRRAKLIATDQTNKLMGNLNEIRQTDLGVKRYTWDAIRDRRTRARHKANDGKKYNWSDRSPGKAFGPPGSEVRCRCTARPDFSHLLKGL